MTKQAIEIIFSKDTLANLQSFKEVEPLNETVRQYKDMIEAMKLRKDVKAKLLTVIEYLKRHSCSFFGVSWKGKRKIAADLGITDKTVTTICKRLEALGFIKQLEMKRPTDMRQTSNAIVIQPLEVKENLHEQTETFGQAGTNKAQNFLTKKTNTYLKQVHKLKDQLNVKAPVKQAIVKYVPKQLQAFRKVFGDNLKELWLRVCRAVKQSKVNISKEARKGLGMNVLTKVVEYFRNGKAQTSEEQVKLAYVIASNQIEQRYVVSTSTNVGVEKTEGNRPSRKVIRREMVPAWLHKQEEKSVHKASAEDDRQAFAELIAKFKEATT